jgi:hypothetical protein
VLGRFTVKGSGEVLHFFFEWGRSLSHGDSARLQHMRKNNNS